MSKAEAALVHEELLRILHYDPNTGVFAWKVKTGKGGCHPIGTVVGTVVIRANRQYLQIRIKKRTHYAHRLAYFYVVGQWPDVQIDHRDTNGLNNAWDNLRDATPSQNGANAVRPCSNTTGFKGVTRKRQNFQARIKVMRKMITLGTRSTPEEAHRLYADAARTYFGEYARSE